MLTISPSNSVTANSVTECTNDRPTKDQKPNTTKPRRGGEPSLMLKERSKLMRPSMYQVVIFNDDYTPMEFVVEILEQFFKMDRSKATQIMLVIHTKGKAVCGVFTHDIASTKARKVVDYAKQHEHPLMCDIEPCTDSEE